MTGPTEDLLRELARQVLGALVRRGADFGAAEDAVQEALLEATTRWADTGVPAEPAAWLTTVARRRLIDAQRADTARRRREQTVAAEPPPGPTEQVDDTLLLLPEATIAQRISRAKRVLANQPLDRPGDVAVVLRVLYLIFNEGYTAGASGIDLGTDAIRLTRLLQRTCPEPEVAGLLALMLLHHARRAARFADAGTLVPLTDQDRSRWDQSMIAEGVRIVTAALAQGRPGEYSSSSPGTHWRS